MIINADHEGYKFLEFSSCWSIFFRKSLADEEGANDCGIDWYWGAVLLMNWFFWKVEVEIAYWLLNSVVPAAYCGGMLKVLLWGVEKDCCDD